MTRQRSTGDARDPNSSWYRRLGKLKIGGLLGGVAALFSIVAALQGWFSSDKSPKPSTKVHVVRPLDEYGNLLPPYREVSRSSGKCIEGLSQSSSDPQAARCFDNKSQVFDPCWTGWVEGSAKAVCLRLPWDPEVHVIDNPAVDGTAPRRTSFGDTPWALEIKTSESKKFQCGFAGGATDLVAGMRVNWRCFRPGEWNKSGYSGDAVGNIRISPTSVWKVFFAPSGSSEVQEAEINDVWR